MHIDKTIRIAILGASRGLGFALSQYCTKQSNDIFLLLVSRKKSDNLSKLNAFAPDNSDAKPTKYFLSDFSSSDNLNLLLNELKNFQADKIFYVAGGGPFGSFQTKKWPDHSWALQVNFLFPAEMLHRILQNLNDFKNLSQIVFVGSSIAEKNPDAKSSSYAASKHGLKGLITSIQAEDPPIDIRLFSPGYMDTQLLPQNAWPRLNYPLKIHQVETLAQILYNWCDDSQFKNQHLELEPFSK